MDIKSVLTFPLRSFIWKLHRTHYHDLQITDAWLRVCNFVELNPIYSVSAEFEIDQRLSPYNRAKLSKAFTRTVNFSNIGSGAWATRWKACAVRSDPSIEAGDDPQSFLVVSPIWRRTTPRAGHFFFTSFSNSSVEITHLLAYFSVANGNCLKVWRSFWKTT